MQIVETVGVREDERLWEARRARSVVSDWPALSIPRGRAEPGSGELGRDRTGASWPLCDGDARTRTESSDALRVVVQWDPALLGPPRSARLEQADRRRSPRIERSLDPLLWRGRSHANRGGGRAFDRSGRSASAASRTRMPARRPSHGRVQPRLERVGGPSTRSSRPAASAGHRPVRRPRVLRSSLAQLVRDYGAAYDLEADMADVRSRVDDVPIALLSAPDANGPTVSPCPGQPTSFVTRLERGGRPAAMRRREGTRAWPTDRERSITSVALE